MSDLATRIAQAGADQSQVSTTIPTQPTDEINQRISQSYAQEAATSLAQTVPGYGINMQGAQQIMNADPEGIPTAASKLVAAAHLSEMTGYPIDFVYHNLDYVTQQRYDQAMNPKDAAIQSWNESRANDFANKTAELWNKVKDLQQQKEFLYGNFSNQDELSKQINSSNPIISTPNPTAIEFTGMEQNVTENMKRLDEEQKVTLDQIKYYQTFTTRHKYDDWKENDNIGLQLYRTTYNLLSPLVQGLSDHLPEAIAITATAALTGGASALAEGLAAGGEVAAGQVLKAGAESALNYGVRGTLGYAMGKQSEGQTYGDLVDSGVTHETATTASDAVGILSGLIGSAQFGRITGITEPILAAQLKTVLTKGTANAIRSGAIKAFGVELATQVGSQAVEQGTLGALQGVTTVLGTSIAQEIDKATVDPAKRLSLTDGAKQILDSALQGALAGTLLSAPHSLLHSFAGARGLTKEAGVAIENIKQAQESVKDMPGVDQRITNSWLQDKLNNDEAQQRFQEKQTNPETRTALWNEEKNQPEILYVGAEEPGQTVLYRSPEDAAKSLETSSKIKPSDLIEKTTEKYGSATGEWVKSVMAGKEELTPAVRDQLQNTNTDNLRNLVQSVTNGSKILSDSEHSIAQDLGLAQNNKQVMAVHADVQPGDFTEDNGKVILKNPDQVVPFGAVDTKDVRIPKSNGELVIRDQGGVYEALNPETKIPEAQIHYQNENGLMKITDVPENPARAKELLDSIDRPYVLDIPQEQKEAILSTDKNYQKGFSDLGKVEESGQKLKQKLESDLQNISDEEKDTITSEALKTAEKLADQRNEILSRLTTREQEVLKEPVVSTGQEFDTAIKGVHADNEVAREKLIQKISEAAPNITREQADVVTRIIDMNASNHGMTLDQWEKTHLRDIQRGELPEGKKGASIFEDGKALLLFNDKSDISTVIHELGHVIRKNLSDVDQIKLAKIYGSVENDERFAKDFEKFFIEGKSFNPEHDTLFSKISYWLGQIYQYFKDKLNPEVRNLIEKQLSTKESDIFYQTDYLDPKYAEGLRNELADLEARDKAGLSDETSNARATQVRSELADIREARKAQIKERVENNERVPTESLQEFAGEPWADEALNEAGGIDSSLLNGDEFPTHESDDLANGLIEALGFKDEGDVILSREDLNRTRKEANREFVAGFDDKWLDDLRTALQVKYDPQNEGFDFPAHLLDVGGIVQRFALSKTPDVSFRNGKTLRELAKSAILKDPNRYRELIALIRQDMDWIAENNRINEKYPLEQDADFRAQKERAASDARIAKLGINERLDRIRGLLDTSAHKASMEQIDTAHEAVGKEITKLKKQYRDLDVQSQQLNERLSTSQKAGEEYRVQLEKAEKTISRLEKKIDKSTQEKTELRESIKEREKFKRFMAMEKISSDLKEKYAERDELRRVKAYKTELLKQIYDKTPKNTDWVYTSLIQHLQENLTTKAQATKDYNKQVRAYQVQRAQLLKDNPGIELPDPEMMYKKHLDNYSIEELEKYRDAIDALEERGQAVRKAKLAVETEKVNTIKRDILNNLRDLHGEVEKSSSFGQVKSNKAKKLFVDSRNIQHIADFIDGGKDWQGPVMEHIVNPMFDLVSKGWDKETERMKGLKDSIDQANKNNPKELPVSGWNKSEKFLKDGKEVKAGNEVLTYGEALGIYVKDRNEKSANATRYGNLIPEDTIEFIKSNLPENWKEVGNWMIEHGWADHVDRLAEVYSNAENKPFIREENYSPMRVQDANGGPMEAELAQETLMRNSQIKKPQEGFTKARINRGTGHQTKIQLDELSLFAREVKKQETYIATKEFSKIVKRVLDDKEVKTMISETIGKEWLDGMNDWLARTVNPDAGKILEGWEGFSRQIRTNASVAYLALNPLSIAKQIGGTLLYMPEAGLHWFSTIPRTIFQFNKQMERMKKLSSEMAHRTMDKILQNNSGSRAKIVQNELAKKGLSGMQAIDNLTIVFGWNAVFNRFKSKINPKTGIFYTDQEAAREATNATTRTQPVGDKMHQSKLMADEGFVSALTLFGSSMNQIWGMLTHLPPAKRNKAFLRYTITLASIVASGMVYGAIGRMGKKNEDVSFAASIVEDGLIGQGIGSTPLIGGPLSNALQGFDAKFPLISSYFETSKEAAHAVDEWHQGKTLTSSQTQAILKSGYETTALTIGLPFLQVQRAIDATKQNDGFMDYMRQFIWGGDKKK